MDSFDGYCVDTGAARSVVGLTQYKVLCRQLGFQLQLLQSNAVFKFGTSSFRSCGICVVRIRLGNNQYLQFEIAVVEENVPFLIGLKIITHYGMILDYDRNVIRGPNNDWLLQMHFMKGHSYVFDNLVDEVFFTRLELERLHNHFLHPSAGKLYNVIKRHHVTKATPAVHDMLEAISKDCSTCQVYNSSPFRFRASVPPENIMFNQELAIYLLWLARRPVLHVVDTHTRYQNAVFIKDKSVQGLWEVSIVCWTSVYTSYPQTIRLDKESSFDNSFFRQACTEQGIHLQFSGVESHNRIGIREKFHGPL